MTTRLFFCCTAIALGLSACQSPATVQSSTQTAIQPQAQTQSQSQSQSQNQDQDKNQGQNTAISSAADAGLVLDATLLEQRQNLLASPNTQTNQARLLRQKNQCIIEFTGQFDAAKVTEYWVFKNDQLLQNHTLYAAAIQSQPQKQQFNPQDPEKYANFLALKQHFSPTALAQCQNFATVAAVTP